MFAICKHVFEELGHARLEFGTGTLDAVYVSGYYGFSLLGVLARQMLVKERSQDTDLYVVLGSQWPSIKMTVAAWLDATHSKEREPEVTSMGSRT